MEMLCKKYMALASCEPGQHLAFKCSIQKSEVLCEQFLSATILLELLLNPVLVIL